MFGKEMLLQPLVNLPGIWIEAGYPYELISPIKSKLEILRPEFVNIAKTLDFSEVLKETFGQITQSNKCNVLDKMLSWFYTVTKKEK